MRSGSPGAEFLFIVSVYNRLAVPHKSDGKEPDKPQVAAAVDHQDDSRIVWSHENRSCECFGERVPGGLVYLERVDGKEAEELVYSEESKTWISPALSEARMQSP